MRRTDARDIAVSAMTAFRKQGSWSDGFLKSAIKKAGLDRRDAALATIITNGVLQNMALLDYYIASYSSIKLSKISSGILDVLRVAAFQILFLDRVPDSAAVNDAVFRAKRGNVRAAGFVNAVLRKISSSKENLPEIKLSGSELLSVKYSHPLWLTRRLASVYGEEAAELILAENNKTPAIFARVNTLKATQDELISKLSDDGVLAEKTSVENCITLSDTGSIEGLQSFKDGLFYIQDSVSQLAAKALGAKSGERIFDACAAPGGKSFVTAQEMENKGEIISQDIYSKKLEVLDEAAKRMGIDIIKCARGDASEERPEFRESFDRVIADVPCSGLGIIRKKPDIRYKSEEEIRTLPELQKKILDNVAGYVKPGGELIYSTCTILPEENEQIAESFLKEHEGFSEVEVPFEVPILKREHGAVFLPHISGTDGFYVCKFRRKK